MEVSFYVASCPDIRIDATKFCRQLYAADIDRPNWEGAQPLSDHQELD